VATFYVQGQNKLVKKLPTSQVINFIIKTQYSTIAQEHMSDLKYFPSI
jgi:hypothetical protein